MGPVTVKQRMQPGAWLRPEITADMEERGETVLTASFPAEGRDLGSLWNMEPVLY